MSKFLAPIHSWLFNKIRINEALEEEVLKHMENGEELSLKLKEKYGDKSSPLPLEEQIDTSNIHGWLKDKIDGSEKRLSNYISHALKNMTMEEMKELFFNFGRTLNILDASNPKEAYKLITDNLVDGMPCDMVYKVVSEDDTNLLYEITKDVHEDNLKDSGLKNEIFLSLRDSMVSGMLSNVNFSFDLESLSPRVYKISKE